MLRYVIERKIVNSEQSNELGGENEEDFKNMIDKLPNLILQKKEGLLLRYGTKIKGYYVAKSSTQ
jgi:hypothetical protein